MTSFLKRGRKTSLLVLIVSAITSISSGASAAERRPWTVESHDDSLVVFLAGIAAGDERVVPIPLSFLAPGKMYQLTLHTDGRGKDDIVTKKTEATRQTTLTIKMNEDGGF
jgi:hypothetical protein